MVAPIGSSGYLWTSAMGLQRAQSRMTFGAQQVVAAATVRSTPPPEPNTPAYQDWAAEIMHGADPLTGGILNVLAGRQAFMANAQALKAGADTSRIILDVLA
jgi:hypothetical protein